MATVPAIDMSQEPGTQQAAHFDGLLEQSRDLICQSLDQAIAGMLDHAKDALTTLIDGTRNFEERRLYEDARGVATTQREDMEKQFRTSYLGEFRRRRERARKIGVVSGESDDGLGQLELVGADDFDETLKFNSMAAKLRGYCDEELVALDQRVGVLLGDANLQANDNPFSPQVICDAYKHACRHAHADAGVRRVLLKLFDDHVLDDVRSMYKAVNALLVQNSILPKIRYSVSRSTDRKTSAGAAARGEVSADGSPNAPAADVTTGVAQDLFTILQNLAANNAVAMGQQGIFRGGVAPGGQAAGGIPGFPGGGVGGMGAAGLAGAPGIAGGVGQAGAGGQVVVLQGADLQSSLTRIQVGDLSGVAGGTLSAPAGAPGTINVLRELKSTSVGAGMGSLDLMTLDIVSMLFDMLFDDPKVPNGVKGVIGRLQIPMLKVAIADKTFFSTKTHPARLLLDTLGDVAFRLPADFGPADPMFAKLQALLEELIEGFKDDLAIFGTVRERVEALLAEDDKKNDQEAQAAAKRVEEMEILAVAKLTAAKEIKARLDTHRMPGPVTDFLAQQWIKLLLLLHVREGNQSEAWKGALDAMDLLIWSIEPKSTREERTKLVALIPGLIHKLAVGLKAAGIDDDVRAAFFSKMMAYHRQAITSPGEGTSQSEAAGLADAKAVDIELDFSAPVTVQNPFGEGEVNVDTLDLDFTALEPGGARPKTVAGTANPLATLTVGSWVEFREAAEQPVRRAARLIFVTPRKTQYLFAVDRAGKDIIQCTPGEISRRFRVGDAVLINEPGAESLFDRIMKGLVGKLRAPTPARA